MTQFEELKSTLTKLGIDFEAKELEYVGRIGKHQYDSFIEIREGIGECTFYFLAGFYQTKSIVEW